MGRKRYVEGRFGQIHIEEFGSGPALLMHHQAPADGNAFRRAAPMIAAAGFRPVLVDMPGFGMSDTPDQPPSVEDLAETVKTVATAVSDKPVAVLGHHTGAMLATEAAAQFPEVVRAVVLYAPLIFTPEEVEEWRTAVVGRERSFTLQADGGHFRDVWEYITGFVPEIQDLETLHWLAMSALRSGSCYWYAHNACINYDSERTLRLLDQSDVPAVIVSNSGDACFGMVARALDACRRIPHIPLSGGSIDFANECPEPWAHAVVDFLRSVETL